MNTAEGKGSAEAQRGATTPREPAPGSLASARPNTTAASAAVEDVRAAFEAAMSDQVVDPDERDRLQAGIDALDAGERGDLFREIVRGDHRANNRYNAASSDLLEFFNVLDRPSSAWQIPRGDLRSRALAEFADAIARHATVEQRSEFIDEAAHEPRLAERRDLAHAIGTALISLEGESRAVYDAMSSLYHPSSRNAPLKAVLDAGVATRAVDPRTGERVTRPHERLDRLIEVVGATLHEGRRAGEISDLWGEFHTANLFEAASRTVLETASAARKPDPAVDGTLGQLAELINRDGGGLVNTLKDGFRSWDGGLEAMFRAALVNGNDRAIAAPLVALRAPLDGLAGAIQHAHDAGDTGEVELLRRRIADNPDIRAIEYAGAELEAAIVETLSEVGRDWARKEAIWTGVARSAGHVLTYAAAQAAAGPGAIGVGIATYVAYAAGGDVISGAYIATGEGIQSRKDMMQAVLTPMNRGLAGDPALDPNSHVEKYSPAWFAMTDLKDAALDWAL